MRTQFSLIIFFSLLFNVFLKAQVTDLPKVIPPSPEASALFRYQDFGVNHSSGLAQINLPIYEVKSGSLSVPISISYNTAGRKVFDVTGPVALGWSLNCGGMISRTVYGKPDDQFFFPSVLKPAASLTNKNDYDYLASLFYNNSSSVVYDSEYDLFSYCFGNNSGKFIVDHTYGGSYKVNLLSANSDAIKFSSDGSDKAFPSIIKDDKGVTYQFALTEQGKPSSIYYFAPISGKLLTSITSADGKDVITFTYTPAVQKSWKRLDQRQLIDNDSRTTTYTQPSWQNTNQGDYCEYTIQRLTEINFRNGKIKFIMYPNTDRINTIQVLNSNNEVIKSIEFQSSVSDIPRFGTTTDSTSKLDHLLFKDRNGQAIENYSFDYYPSYDFDTNDRDYWGLLNNPYSSTSKSTSFTSNSTAVPSNDHISVSYGDNGNSASINYSLIGGRREAITPTNGVLKKITFPTGGSTEFEYESNTYQPAPNSPYVIGSGLRVAAIKTTDNAGGTYLKTYKYGANECGYGYISNGKIYPSETGFEKRYFTDFSGTSGTVVVPSYRKRIYSSDFMSGVADIDNDPVYYTEVAEYNGTPTNNSGKTVYYYNINTKYSAENMPTPVFPGVAPSPYQYLNFSSFSYDPDLVQRHIYQYNLWKGTKLSGTTIFKNNGVDATGNILYTPVKSISNNYIYTPTGSAKGFHINKFVECSSSDVGSPSTPGTTGGEGTGAREIGLPIFLYDDYEITMGKVELQSTSESDYTANGQISKTTTYTYNSNLLPVTINTVSSKKDNIKTTIKYPPDFTSDPALGPISAKMVDANMLNYPIVQSTEKITGTTTTALKSTQTNYYDWNPNSSQTSPPQIAPIAISTQVLNNPYESRIRYYGYDNMGNILSVSKPNGLYNSYIWGYNQAYPTAQAENAKSNEIFFDSFEEGRGWDGTLEPVYSDRPITAYDESMPHAGRASGKIYKPDAGEQYSHYNKVLSVSLAKPTKFKYSGWVFSNGPSADIYLFMKRAGESYYYSYVDYVRTTVTNSWVLLEKEFVVPADVTQIGIRIDNNGGGTVWFDDLRIHPSAAQMSTYTYHPLIGKTSESDINNRTTYYQYDDYGRLSLIRNKEANILKRFCYNYQGQQENCTVFGNQPYTQTFTHTCPSTCYVGSNFVYTVPANKYFATNQYDANQQAKQEADQKGQAAADADPNATCTLRTSSNQSVNIHNGTPNIQGTSRQPDFTITFTNTCNGTSLSPIYTNGNIDVSSSVPAGVYSVQIQLIGSSSGPVYTFNINGLTATSNYNVQFQKVDLGNSGCNITIQ